MYAPPVFADADPARLSAFIRAHPFATLTANGPEGPIAAYAPLCLECDPDGRPRALVGLLARANPFWEMADGGSVLAIFAGSDGYVSPSYYPSKADHGRVVPTWNYERVEARGALAVESHPDRVRPYVERATQHMEARRDPPWRLADAPGDYLERQLAGLVGLRLQITALEGVRKLSQNKSRADFDGVRAGLRAAGDPAALVADAMDDVLTEG